MPAAESTPAKTPILNVNAMLARLQTSNLATAERTATQLHDGLGQLTQQIDRDKTSAWPNTTAHLIDGLRNNALDGIDVQVAMQAQTESVGAHHREAIRRTSQTARSALFAHASPAAAANLFCQHVGPFTSRCVSVLHDLQTLLSPKHQDRDAERARAVPRETNSPGVKGI